MKSEPDVFSIDDLCRKKVAGWDGVRNYQARKNLRAMRKGDLAFFYHSSIQPPVIAGLMEIAREAYPDSSAKEGDWDQVDVKFVQTFPRPLSIEDVKKIPELREMVLLKNSRLSVQPVAQAEWDTVMKRVTS